MPVSALIIRRFLERAIHDIRDFLDYERENEKARNEASELYESMVANKTPPEVRGQGSPKLTPEQYAAIKWQSAGGKPITDEQREEILAGVLPRQTMGDKGYASLELALRGGWRESTRQAATWLRKGGEAVAADWIECALEELGKASDAGDRSWLCDATRTAAEDLLRILSNCLPDEPTDATNAIPCQQSAHQEPVANPNWITPIDGDPVLRSSTKLPLISNNVHVGMVEVLGLTKLCNSLLRQGERQETLYRDKAGRFIYHILETDDESIGRACVLVPPAVAYEIAKNADELHVDSVELFTEFDELLKQIAKEREAAFDDAILGYADSDWKRDDSLNNKAWRVRSKNQTGELFGEDASKRGWYQSKTGARVIKKDSEGVWVYLTASHSAKLKEFFSAFVA